MDGKIAIIAGGAEGTEIYPYLAEAGVGPVSYTHLKKMGIWKTSSKVVNA